MSALQLPALAIEAKAELITNNLPAFEESFRKGLENLKYELLSDDDFTKAKEDIKALKAAEKTISDVDQAIVNGSLDIKAIRESLSQLCVEAREFRLSREKEIKQRDARIKAEIFEEALSLIDHPSRENFRKKIEEAAKGKRTFATMRKGATLAAKSINDEILKSRAILDQFENEHGRTLIPDRMSLELESQEKVSSELLHRLEKKKDEEEKARLRAEAEEARKKAEEALAKEKPEPVETDEPVKPASPVQAPDPSRPVPQQGESERAEMLRFIETVEASFKPVKEARKALKHSQNITKAAVFAEMLGRTWREFKEGGLSK